MCRVISFYVGDRPIGPLIELLGKGAVLRVEKRKAQVRGPAHIWFSPRSSVIRA
jgi:hypothetical protein